MLPVDIEHTSACWQHMCNTEVHNQCSDQNRDLTSQHARYARGLSATPQGAVTTCAAASAINYAAPLLRPVPPTPLQLTANVATTNAAATSATVGYLVSWQPSCQAALRHAVSVVAYLCACLHMCCTTKCVLETKVDMCRYALPFSRESDIRICSNPNHGENDMVRRVLTTCPGTKVEYMPIALARTP